MLSFNTSPNSFVFMVSVRYFCVNRITISSYSGFIRLKHLSGSELDEKPILPINRPISVCSDAESGTELLPSRNYIIQLQNPAHQRQTERSADQLQECFLHCRPRWLPHRMRPGHTCCSSGSGTRSVPCHQPYRHFQA